MKLGLFPLLAVTIIGGSQVESHSQHHHGHLKPRNRNDMKTTIPKLDVSNMDKSTSPLDNFYQFVNGGWLKKNSIPSDKVMWGCASEVEERVGIELKEIIVKASKTPGNLIGDMYNLGMNEEAIEKSGLTDISDLFKEISNIKNKKNIPSFLGRLHSEGFVDSPFFSVEPRPDFKNSSHIIAHMNQGGLGLPLEYYFDKGKAKEMKAYKEHIQKMFALADQTNPKMMAADAYNIELFLAKVSVPIKTYNKYPYDRLKSLTKISWDSYFKKLGLKPNSYGEVIINDPRFFKSLHEVFTDFKLSQIQNYLKWFILHNAARFLPKPFHEENFQFFDQFLFGQQERAPRWKDVMKVISSNFHNLLGKLYTNKVFPPEAKKQALKMAKYIQVALLQRIKKLNWIKKSTKEKAIVKGKNINFKIGYPDHWDEYSDLELDISRSYLYNFLKVRRRAKMKEMEYINKSVDRLKWNDACYDVSTSNNQELNEVVFPAAILQPIFFFSSNKSFSVDDMAFNFGGIGSIIGNQLIHGFDKYGRNHDSNGTLVNWWTEKDSNKFEERAKTIIDQFNKLTFHNQKVNGELTQEENIADLEGLKISYTAFQNWKKKNDKPKKLHGFSPNQQSFIAYAQIHRMLMTKKHALLRLQYDDQAPRIHRVNQPLSNMQEFYDAFGQPRPNQGMFREKKDRVEIW